ncbi:tRNA (adenosine(37)-N6)-threonylcarbamoyltransferase complex ATPase subunit type 1 TsaE [Candidatus Kinetoplastidibacterium crithidiae]|uniref:tRNA threonylcarbamoyladenosine biosynthesis protein TsaE n=2 Tax=Candidatus Kinetoplastidibacterium crithidiae TaxID=33056 RepID=M1M6X7_9PROT|nr:tRNA (adenosine(37)-N6)-threonylcarbamoyltransferase complex ATPase subunit type 1 TsaE [Candidatus Kinetoplastibacterium crithidii]AFZ82504.1 ATPase YjeE protein [Candidatus Kinetoplastibacterium crithidii (ex Angomonas deanei ATCC 30255)]AGF47835.1 YjeE ATPase [Candidatus Kinetoplastibacterium crithidii TCC036E]
MNTSNNIDLFLPKPNNTDYFANTLGTTILIKNKKPIRIYLTGEIGTGKTTFARSFLKTIGVIDKIKSPSYSILEQYNIDNLNIYHFDFYRLNHHMEFLDLGFKDLLYEKAIFLIEWPEKTKEFLPTPDIEISFQCYKEGRIAKVLARTIQGIEWMKIMETKNINLQYLL